MLGRGGRYIVGLDETAETAVGFTLYMDALRKLSPDPEDRERIEVDFSQGWDKLLELCEQGKVVVRGSKVDTKKG